MAWVWSDELAAMLEEAGADKRVVDELRSTTFGISIRSEPATAKRGETSSSQLRGENEH